MRILVVNWKDPQDPTTGGAEEYARQMAEIWALQGHQVDLLVPRRRGQAHEETIGGVRYIRNGPRVAIFAVARSYARRHINDYDVMVELVSTRPFFLHEIAGDRASTLYLQPAKDVWSLEFRPPISWMGRYFLEPRWLRRLKGARLISISPSTSAALVAEGLEVEAVVPPGCDMPPADAGPRRLGEPPRLAYLGRVVRTKRTGDAVEAFEIVRRRHAGATLDVIGTGYLLEELEARPHPGVTYHGFVSTEQKDRILSTTDVLLIPGTREGWGIVAIEAAVRGIPVVAYDIPGLRDAVVNGTTGILTEPSPAAMAEAALNLVANAPQWGAMSRNAMTRGRGYTWEATSAGVLEAATGSAPGAPR